MVDKLRIISSELLSEEPILIRYHDLLSGRIKALPKGTWQNDRNVVILVRYVLEIRLELSKEEIPKITKEDIHRNKLWGALNRFKSIRRLLYFVYPGKYNDMDFPRITAGYWSDKERIKDHLEGILQKQGFTIADIPNVVNYDILIKWGFSNPLKRHGHSPYRLLNALYPNQFAPSDFKKVPHLFHQDVSTLKKQFQNMLHKEQISFKDAPSKVNREMLIRYRFGGILSDYSNSASKLIMTLFPDSFSIIDFPMVSNGYWDDLLNVKSAINQFLQDEGISEEDIPRFLTKKKLKEANLGGLLMHFNGSPIDIVEAHFIRGNLQRLNFKWFQINIGMIKKIVSKV